MRFLIPLEVEVKATATSTISTEKVIARLELIKRWPQTPEVIEEIQSLERLLAKRAKK